MARLTDEERHWRQGFGLAIAEVQRHHDQPSVLSQVMLSCDMTVAKLQSAGLDDYDLKEIRKVMRDVR